MKRTKRCVVTRIDKQQIGFVPRKPTCHVTVAGDFGELDFDAPESYFEVGDPAYIKLYMKRKRGKK